MFKLLKLIRGDRVKAYRPTVMATNGAVTTPHYLASQAGMKILQIGGNAIHAAISIAATLGVVYPHMNGLGGDNFWLFYNAKTKELKGINASGRSGEMADIAYYHQLGYDTIPERGYLAANTVPGALSGWLKAYEYAESDMEQTMNWSELLEDAIEYAENGFPITDSQIKMAKSFLAKEASNEERTNNDFYSIFIEPLLHCKGAGQLFYQKDLANTLRAIAKDKGHSFYHGDIAAKMVEMCQSQHGVLTKQDLANHTADWMEPIAVDYRGYKAYNLPPNTQGIASLSILNMINQFDLSEIKNDAFYYHLIVEATKLAFEDRDRWVTDPEYTMPPIDQLLSKQYGQQLAEVIENKEEAGTFTALLDPRGDTVWFGVVDKWGNAVSMIQSIYHEYGAAVVPPETGVLLQNRGSFFSLDEEAINRLEPKKRTFHTLNPAMLFKNNRPHLVYGTMGGEGQPQTQAALVTRIIDYKYGVQEAIEAPRWLYGRTWGASSNTLKLEKRIDPSVQAMLRKKGHDIELVESYSDMMGHAGAILIDDENIKLAGSDPRSDGIALGY
ncbi:gamma-glutamyltransferase [Gracilibacillus thailandensis]|uniref:gamma-glutamyltransferase n=1 Tax=Gracilibacillus thailandensis TaxID=563735 RepID=UPI001F09BF48|nr:gamma-glutamyltransferase [Gracilibacillus thailandensis]